MIDTMTPKERFISAICFEKPDKPALEYYYTEVGYAEHGEKLAALYKTNPGDAAPYIPMPLDKLPRPDPADIGPDGKYRKIFTSEWGTVWECRIFGRIGHAVGFPLDDLGKLDAYQFPPFPDVRARISGGGDYPAQYSVPGLFETMIALRPFEDVLADLGSEEPLLEELADRLTDRFAAEVEAALSAGVDIIRIGDDYGTGTALLVSPDMWRRFFKPRLHKIIGPIKKAGALCCFHSCGNIWDIFGELKEIGCDSIWPQLPLYDWPALASHLRSLGLALSMHIDRGKLMQHGTPEQIKSEVRRMYDIFRPDLGGSWFYFEVDQGFPFINVAALAESIAVYRG